MSLIEAIILAIIEGLTEFLPISSTGHMIIASSFMGIASHPFTKTFTVAIQLGAILSVVVMYWKRFFQTLDFYFKLFVAFLPAAVLGFLFNKIVDQFLDRVDIVGFALLIGGLVLVFVDKWFEKNESYESKDVTYKQSFIIGAYQCIALFFPGISRSAATIIGGLTQKLNRKTAAEFSFFLAVPTMFAATGYKLLQFFLDGNVLNSSETSNLIVANVIAFIVAWIAIRSFINFLTKNGFKIFGYYRIIIGIILLVLYYSGFEFSML